VCLVPTTLTAALRITGTGACCQRSVRLSKLRQYFIPNEPDQHLPFAVFYRVGKLLPIDLQIFVVDEPVQGSNPSARSELP
jgi:hypothetical protein